MVISSNVLHSLDSVLSLVSIEKAQSKGKKEVLKSMQKIYYIVKILSVFLPLISFYSKEFPTLHFLLLRHFDIFSINILNRRTRRSSQDNKRQRMLSYSHFFSLRKSHFYLKFLELVPIRRYFL